MRQFILFLFVLLPFCVSSQVNETFDGPEIDSANPWRADSAGFFIEDGHLVFDASRRAKGVHTVKLDIPYSDNMEWMFDIRFSYKPTNNNHVRVFVYATGAPTDIAYFVQVGHNDGNVSLYSWPSSTDPQRAITGRGGILTKASNGVRVKLTLENNSKVVLYTRLETENCFHKEGECKVASLGIRKGGVLNLQCRYQAASKDDMITTFDNIIVSDHITPTPLEPEEPDEPAPSPGELPELLEIQPVTASSLQFIFDKPVGIKNAVFSISDIGDAYRTGYANNEAIVNAQFDKEMEVGKRYTISYRGLTDLSGNRLFDHSEEVILKVEEEPEPEPEPDDDDTADAPASSILINEVMAKPGDAPGMVEYIELYNTASTSVSLKKWVYKNVTGKKTKALPDVILKTGGYAVLFDSRNELETDKEALRIPVETFPALNDQGALLHLYNASGTLIDSVTYAKATAGKSWERSASGWHLSTDLRGGTPGSANSSPSSEEEKPPVDPDKPEDPDIPDTPAVTDPVQPGEIVFNELLPEPYVGGSEYIELYNRSDKPLSVSDLSLAVRKSDGTLNTRYPLAAIIRNLEAGSYILLTKDVESVSSFYEIAEPSALYQLSKLPVLANTASTLVLFRTADGEVIDEVSYSSKWHAPSVKNRKGVALERIDPDAATQNPANWTSASETAGFGTPGYQNSQYGNPSSEGSTGIEPPVWIEETGSYRISYLLDRPGYNCRAFVFNTSGMRVAEIANHQLLGTSGDLTWSGIANSGSTLPAGIYIFYAEIYHPDGVVKRFKKAFLIR